MFVAVHDDMAMIADLAVIDRVATEHIYEG
jgi:hypothetical protein